MEFHGTGMSRPGPNATDDNAEIEELRSAIPNDHQSISVLVQILHERYRTVYEGLIATQKIFTHAAIAVLAGTSAVLVLHHFAKPTPNITILIIGGNGMLAYASQRNWLLLKLRLRQLDIFQLALDVCVEKLFPNAPLKLPSIKRDTASALSGKVYLFIAFSAIVGVALLVWSLLTVTEVGIRGDRS